jgi:hypothetical protein
MAITQSVPTSFKQELMQALHNFNTAGGHTFKVALYSNLATLDSSTLIYTASNEVVGPGYVAGGNTLTVTSPVTSGTTAYIDFDDTTWTASTLSVRGAMIYNSSSGNRAVAILDFGADKASSAGNFTIVFPTPAAATAIIRVS